MTCNIYKTGQEYNWKKLENPLVKTTKNTLLL